VIDMRRVVRCDLRLLAGILAGAAVWSLAQSAHAGPRAAVVPSAIAVTGAHKVFLVVDAVGVQIYACRATASGFAWTFVAPRADLYGRNGKLVGTHYAGPTWEARDGSTVVAQRVNGVTPDATAIPWLLLSTVSTTSGSDGDRLTRTTFIQRIDTVGGLAPAAAGCSAATVGAVAEVPYTAVYVFWKATGR
jgi:FtsP/CotA-like multicopper oxidase with cupredoxin domain